MHTFKEKEGMRGWGLVFFSSKHHIKHEESFTAICDCDF